MLTVIGDVHGESRRYLRVIANCDASVQIGDLGFSPALAAIDPDRHRFFGGNHDRYEDYYHLPHALGDFGRISHGGVSFFFMRGAFSVDQFARLRSGLYWSADEELTDAILLEATAAYIDAKPDIVLTHDCPSSVAKLIGDPHILRGFGYDPETFSTRTQDALQQMFEAYRPSRWIFGHFHKSWRREIKGTRFQCLNELETTTVEADLAAGAE